MPHKYRALIGRQSPRPASRGIIAQFEPRRRNCRRAISLAATKQVGQKRFLQEKSRFRGLPRNAGHPFGRQGISSSVNAAGIPVGCLESGKKVLPTHRQTNFCASMRRNNIPHDNTRARAATAFWPKPQKAAKGLFNPRHQAGGAVTGGDVSRIARNSHRKRRSASPVRQPSLPQACGEVWPRNRVERPSHGCVRPLPFFGVKKAAKHAVPRRQAKNAVSVFRRRRIGGVESPFSLC